MRPFQFQGIFVYFMTYNSHGNRSIFLLNLADSGIFQVYSCLFLKFYYFYLEELLFLFHLRSTLSKSTLSALRSPLYAHIQVSSHFVEAKTSCMNECVWIRVQTTHYSKQIVQMLTIGPLTPFSNCFSRHLLEVRRSACWQLRNRQIILLNLWGHAGIQWDDAS